MKHIWLKKVFFAKQVFVHLIVVFVFPQPKMYTHDA